MNSPVKKKHHIKSLVFRIFLIAIAGMTVGLSFFSWNATRVVGNQLPMPFGFGASVVLSGSMDPTLKVNDLVFITESDDYQPDDIVVYQNGSELIIHRIVSIDGDQVITKGDANPVADNPIGADMIKGKYSFRIPYIGFLFRFIKTLPGTLLILALVVWLMYRSRKKERQTGNEELEKIADEIRQLRMQQLEGSQGVEAQPDEAEQPAEEEPKTGEDNPPADSQEDASVESDQTAPEPESDPAENDPTADNEAAASSESDAPECDASEISDVMDLIDRIE